MKVAEIFGSIQGEGLLTGVPSVFVRTSGCNLRCWFCDSDYTSWHPEGENLSVDAILDRLAPFPASHAVVTGGEPMIAPGIEELTQGLRSRGYHITIETAATVFKPVACDLASLSPKLASSTPVEREGGRFAERHERLRLAAGRAPRLHEPFSIPAEVRDRPLRGPGRSATPPGGVARS